MPRISAWPACSSLCGDIQDNFASFSWGSSWTFDYWMFETFDWDQSAPSFLRRVSWIFDACTFETFEMFQTFGHLMFEVFDWDHSAPSCLRLESWTYDAWTFETFDSKAFERCDRCQFAPSCWGITPQTSILYTNATHCNDSRDSDCNRKSQHRHNRHLGQTPQTSIPYTKTTQYNDSKYSDCNRKSQQCHKRHPGQADRGFLRTIVTAP